jgi:hypothetical protein
MNDLIHFLEPLFSSFLFNYKNLTLIEISILCSVFLFGTIGKFIVQKPNTSIALTGYIISISLFLCSGYLTFIELVWWKAIVNIVVSLVVFVIFSEMILNLIIILFGGFYNYLNGEIKPKRRALFFVLVVFGINLFVSEYIKRKFF